MPRATLFAELAWKSSRGIEAAIRVRDVAARVAEAMGALASATALAALAVLAGDPRVAEAPTALAALGLCGPPLAQRVAEEARRRLDGMMDGSGTVADVVVVDRAGAVIGRAGP